MRAGGDVHFGGFSGHAAAGRVRKRKAMPCPHDEFIFSTRLIYLWLLSHNTPGDGFAFS